MFNEILTEIQKTITLIQSTTPAAILTTVGILLFTIAIVSLIGIAKLKPEQTPTWLKVVAVGSLILAVIFCTAGPSVAIIAQYNDLKQKFAEERKDLIHKVSENIAYDNLKTNREVAWLIRLIPYNPNIKKDVDNLAVGKLKTIGPEDVRFAFVGPYQELKGYKVAEAVKKLGGSVSQGIHVSAIIFRLNKEIDYNNQKVHLFPASARGLLQVVKYLEDTEKDIHNKLILDHTLNVEEIEDLDNTDLPSWGWDQYKSNYNKYCKLADKFRCGNYDASRFISAVKYDWHPIGISSSDRTNICKNPDQSAAECNAKEWDDLVRLTSSKFGSRVFLIPNLELSQLDDRYLIDFGDPANQVIPEIGAPEDSQ